jgi:hypothetical protein
LLEILCISGKILKHSALMCKITSYVENERYTFREDFYQQASNQRKYIVHTLNSCYRASY